MDVEGIPAGRLLQDFYLWGSHSAWLGLPISQTEQIIFFDMLLPLLLMNLLLVVYAWHRCEHSAQ